MQCFVKSANSLAVQSPLGFCFKLSHHASLPISGEHADKVKIIINDAISAANCFMCVAFCSDFERLLLLVNNFSVEDGIAHLVI